MRTRTIVVLILGAAAIVAAAFIGGRATAPITITPSTTSAEAGFARDMQRHHLQAVGMSITVRDLTDDVAVRTLAYDIATTQQQQAGQMYAWLNMWGVPQASAEPSMTWMTRPTLDGDAHSHGSGDSPHVPGEPMPGLATPEQLAELESLTGVEAERYYLDLMIAHHKGGIEMAKAVLDRSENDIVTSLAAGMVAAQQSEIDLMEGMLAERQ
ncbi:MAG: DUF305 domain-containing protein [Microbacteriaceae bacterium]